MKNIYVLLLFIAVLLSAENLHSQYASQVTQFPFINGPTAYGAPTCIGGLVYDDGTFENGYGWNPGMGTGKWVMKMTPSSYPFQIVQICIAGTRVSAGSANWTFDLEIWDTTGAGGAPGTMVWSLTNQVMTGVPIWPAVNWFDFTNLTGIPPLQNGSYYVGISYDPNTMPSHYIGADQSTTTPLQPGYGYIQSAWAPITTYFSNYRAIGVRVESGQTIAHDFAVGPFLSLPDIFHAGQSYNIKAFVSNSGSSNEYNVPIKFFVGATQEGLVNLSLNSGAYDSVSYVWTPPTEGQYTLTIASALSTDLNRNNDTVRTTVYVLPSSPPSSVFDSCRHHVHMYILNNTPTYDSILAPLPQSACYILDVNVKIDTVHHTWDSDLSFYLIHHGVTVNFIERVGGSGDNFIHTVLDDSATIPISSGSAPFTGTFIPSNPLSALNGYHYAGGMWLLKIFDNLGGDTGMLEAWCVTITYYSCTGGIHTVTIPNYYALKQNYPNPFNPSTKIEYYIPRAGNVRLIVYDITGREVAVLVNEYKNPGIYSVDFNASALSSGVYFYKIQSGEFIDIKKMVLLK